MIERDKHLSSRTENPVAEIFPVGDMDRDHAKKHGIETGIGDLFARLDDDFRQAVEGVEVDKEKIRRALEFAE